MPIKEDKMQMPPRRRSLCMRWVLIGCWLLLVAGWPVYYLLPDRDWYYPCWGAPLEILESRRISENPHYRNENVYSRVFIVRPSEKNLAYFRNLEYSNCLYSETVESLLKEYSLPAPYHVSNTGCVNFSLCGNGLMMVHDFSRNKGGLFSSRLAYPEVVLRSYPQRFVFHYVWAWVSLVTLALSPLLFLLRWVLTRCIGVFGRHRQQKCRKRSTKCLPRASIY